MASRHLAPLGRPSDPGYRGRLMARVKPRDTEPELVVRRVVTSLGARYRLQRRDLPGTPDLVFAARRKVLFVHGCFWHSHEGCRHATVPKTRVDYWDRKLADNRARDARVSAELHALGWEVGPIWECQTRNIDRLSRLLADFLELEVDVSDEPADDAESVRKERSCV